MVKLLEARWHRRYIQKCCRRRHENRSRYMLPCANLFPKSLNQPPVITASRWIPNWTHGKRRQSLRVHKLIFLPARSGRVRRHASTFIFRSRNNHVEAARLETPKICNQVSSSNQAIPPQLPPNKPFLPPQITSIHLASSVKVPREIWRETLLEAEETSHCRR